LLAGTVAQFGHDDQMTFDIQPPQRMLKTNHDLTTLSDAMPSMPCQKLGEKEFGAYKTTSIGEFVLFYPYPWFVLWTNLVANKCGCLDGGRMFILR
jgi:hypothetical protein